VDPEGFEPSSKHSTRYAFYMLICCLIVGEAEGQPITYTTPLGTVSRLLIAPLANQFHFSVPLLPVQRNRTPAGQKLC
jgi:hypothetical protein